MTLLEQVVARIIAAGLAGARAEDAVMQGLAPALPLLTDMAAHALAGAADVFLRLAATPAQPGYENVTGTDDARAKLAAELAAAGEAGPRGG